MATKPLLPREKVDRWVAETLRPAWRGERPGGNLAIISADVDRIKEYVFESYRLPEIRGASMLLDSLNRDWLGKSLRGVLARLGLPIGQEDDESAPSCVVYAAGGSLLALVPQELDGVDVAQTLQRQIEALYPEETDVATVTCVWQPVSDLDVLNCDFRRLMDAQTMRLRRRKEEREVVPFIEALPHQRRCESCGARPAVKFRPEPSERWLCTACEKKACNSDKAFWSNQFVERLKKGLPGVNLAHYQGDAPDLEAVESALDLSEIAAAGNGRSIGFIYADGDKVGQLIEESPSLQEYHQRSRALTTLLPDLVYTALGRHLCVCPPIERQGKDPKSKWKVFVHPFEILTIGGDDLLLIVPGDVALPIALDIGVTFAEKFKGQTLGRAPTMSAGVVIADHRNPVRFMRDLAEQLLKSAKKRAHEATEQRVEDGAVDFVVLKSQSMLAGDLSDLRRQIYHFSTPPEKPDEQIWLTGRPFLWREMKDLLAHARLLRDTAHPRSQMQALRGVLQEGRRFGRLWPSLWYMRQQLRVSRTHLAVMKRIDKTWGEDNPANHSAAPWVRVPHKKDQVRYMTVWEDLYQVRELLPPAKREPDDIRQEAEALKRAVLERAEEEESDED